MHNKNTQMYHYESQKSMHTKSLISN